MHDGRSTGIGYNAVMIVLHQGVGTIFMRTAMLLLYQS